MCCSDRLLTVEVWVVVAVGSAGLSGGVVAVEASDACWREQHVATYRVDHSLCDLRPEQVLRWLHPLHLLHLTEVEFG